MKIPLKKIRAGLYELVGVNCGGDKIYGPCGGSIRTERNSANRGAIDRDFTWETFCIKCDTCDPSGHRTLAQVVANTEFWRAAR